jgi:2C-methyl-D-erythritol 2,4-cyclodiphosphate synthase
VLRHCYKAILPKGFVCELKKDFEIHFRSPATKRDAEDMRKEIAFKLHIPDENVKIVSIEEFEEVAKVNVLPPRQLTMF